MSIRQIAARRLAVVFVMTIVLGATFLFFASRSSSLQLRFIRDEVDQLLTIVDPQQRTESAADCVRVARELLSDEDPVGATACLYLIAVSPSDASDLQVPPEARVETIATIDLLKIARLFFQSRRFGPADQLVDLILSRNDDLYELGLRLAVTVRFEIGRDDDVMRHCQKILERVPDDPGIYRVMSMVHRNHGRMEQFIECTEKTLQLGDPNDYETRVNLVDGYVRLGRTSDARREFDKVAKNRPDLVQRAPTLHAQLLTQEGKPGEALEILDRFLAVVPDDAEALLLKGTMLVGEQKFEEAIRTLNAAVEAYPAEEQAYYQLGQAYARTGQQELAKKSLAQHQDILDTKVSIHEMEQIASRDPDNVTIRVELAHAYARIGIMNLADFWTRAAMAADGR